MKGNSYNKLKLTLLPFLLDFAEDDVHVSEGDVLAVDHSAVLAEFGPVLAVQVFAGSAGVTVDGEAAKRLLQSGQLHRCGRARASFTGPVRLSGKPLGQAVSRLFTVRPQRGRAHVGMLGCLDFKVIEVVSEGGNTTSSDHPCGVRAAVFS